MIGVTLLGWYNYTDETLFHEIEYSDRLDPGILVDTILLRCGNQFTYFQNEKMLRKAINNFFKKYYVSFDRMAYALEIEYNPLENYNRTDDYTKTTDASSTSNIKSESEANGTREDKVSAYNESTYQPKQYVDSDNSSSDTQDSESTNKVEEEYQLKSHGNIGVTTNQKMATDELRLRETSLYDKIAEMFEHDIMLQVY